MAFENSFVLYTKISKFRPIKPERLARIQSVAAKRQFNLTVVLENVHDPYNIGAVLRSCDSVGIREIFVVYTEKGLMTNELSIGRRTAMGTQKWVDVNFYTNLEACMQAVTSRYQHLYTTHIGPDSKSVFELDLTQNVALIFGNESDGLSSEILKYSTGNFIIPQFGMAQSLNISVACAISVYEAMRQRIQKDFYGPNNPAESNQQQALLEDYIDRHENNFSGKEVFRKG